MWFSENIQAAEFMSRETCFCGFIKKKWFCGFGKKREILSNLISFLGFYRTISEIFRFSKNYFRGNSFLRIWQNKNLMGIYFRGIWVKVPAKISSIYVHYESDVRNFVVCIFVDFSLNWGIMRVCTILLVYIANVSVYMNYFSARHYNTPVQNRLIFFRCLPLASHI